MCLYLRVFICAFNNGELFCLCYSASGASVVAIDNKIEQAMVSVL